MDLPYAQEIAERYQALLPPPIQQMISKGKTLPPEVNAAMAQVSQAQQMVQQHGQLVQAAEQELKELQAQVKGDAASAKLAQANVKTAEASLQSQLDTARGELALSQQKLDSDRQLLAKEVENATLKIKLAEKVAAGALTADLHQQEVAHMSHEHAMEGRERDLQGAVKDEAHALDNHERDVSDAVKDGSQQLKDQATQNSVASMQAQHKQALGQAKANKPKPKK